MLNRINSILKESQNPTKSTHSTTNSTKTDLTNTNTNTNTNTQVVSTHERPQESKQGTSDKEGKQILEGRLMLEPRTKEYDRNGDPNGFLPSTNHMLIIYVST